MQCRAKYNPCFFCNYYIYTIIEMKNTKQKNNYEKLMNEYKKNNCDICARLQNN